MAYHRGFSLLLVVIGIAVLAALGYGGYLSLHEPSAVTEYATDTDRVEVKKVSFVPPEGWTVERKVVSPENESYILRSPDYEPSSVPCEMGGYCEIPGGGTQITVRAGGGWNLYHSSEEEMLNSVKDYKKTCGNCAFQEVIYLDGVPALLRISVMKDGSGLVINESAGVGFQVQDTQYYVSLLSPKQYNENKESFQSFLGSVNIDE